MPKQDRGGAAARCVGATLCGGPRFARRASEGGSYHVRISLARAAMWYQSLGAFPTTDFDANDPAHRMTAPRTVTGKTCYGEVLRLAPLARLSKTESRWREPLLVVRGGDLPKWEG